MMVTLSDQFGSPYMTAGGQGKFFPDPKPVAQHRYQRGYTPERMNEVRQAPIDIETPSSEGRQSPSVRYAHGQIHKSARQAAETIARSTVSMHDYGQGAADVAARRTYMTGNVSADDLWPLHISTSGSKPGTAGTYQSGGTWGRGEINIATGLRQEKASQTLLHEMGHYHSHKIEPSESNEYNTPARVGREEAHADDYMVTHWRPDPRDVRRGKSEAPRGTYESSDAFFGQGGKKAHGPYITARQTLKPEEKKRIRQYGFRASFGRQSEPFTHEATGERWMPVGEGRDWHVQGALFHDRRG
jgi:hypothetical protein